MSAWVEYDPLTGVRETNVTDEETNTVIVHKEQRIDGLLDYCAHLRNTGETDQGIKKGLWHVCKIPLVTQYELLSKYGLNIHRKDHTERVAQVLERDYPHLKTTDKRFSRQRG